LSGRGSPHLKYWAGVRYPSCLSTENTRKLSITHALVSKVLSLSFIVHHFRISIILDCASILYLLYHFIYYKNPMYTTFSVVESIPPTHQSSSPPSFVQFSPVVVVSFSPPVVKISQALLTRSIPVHARLRSRLRSVHARSVYGSRRASQFTTRISTLPPSTVPRISFSSYLRRPLGYSHRPSHNTHPENLSFDSQTIRSFYISYNGVPVS